MSKLIIKYVRIVDNTSLESYLVQGDVYGVVEETTGDLFDFYRLDVNTPYQEGLWVNKSRCSDITICHASKATIDAAIERLLLAAPPQITVQLEPLIQGARGRQTNIYALSVGRPASSIEKSALINSTPDTSHSSPKLRRII